MLQLSVVLIISGMTCNSFSRYQLLQPLFLSSYLESVIIVVVFTHNSCGVITCSSTDNVSRRLS